VIGNPPYVNVENIEKTQRKFMMADYETAIKRFDIYIAFIEKGMKLLRKQGWLSYIIPYPFLNQNYAEILRQKIINEYELIKIVDFSNVKVFGDAVVRNCIIVVKKPNVRKVSGAIDVYVASLKENYLTPEILKAHTIQKDFVRRMPKFMLRLQINDTNEKILNKINNQSIKLGDICYVNWGARTGNIKKYVSTKIIDNNSKKMINARNIDRYSINWTGEYIWYKKDELYNPMFEDLFENEKLIIRDISGKSRLKATFDNKNFYAEHTVSLCVLKHLLPKEKVRDIKIPTKKIEELKKYNIKFLLSLINSRLSSYYFHLLLGGGLHVYPDDVKQLPIRKIDFSIPPEKKLHDNLVALVDVMLNLNMKIQTAKGSAKDQIQRQIDKTDKEIDEIVYNLYGITEEKKKIIEEGAK
jgi:hypothetical protein